MPFQIPSGTPVITKNSSYIYYFFMTDSQITPVPVAGKTGLTFTTKLISKDGGAFATTTNTPVEIANGWYKITLTSTEMNADAVLLNFKGTNSNIDSAILFTTASGSSGLTAQQVWEYTTRSLTASGGLDLDTSLTDDGVLTGNGTVGDVLKALFYFLKKNKNRKTITR